MGYFSEMALNKQEELGLPAEQVPAGDAFEDEETFDELPVPSASRSAVSPAVETPPSPAFDADDGAEELAEMNRDDASEAEGADGDDAGKEQEAPAKADVTTDADEEKRRAEHEAAEAKRKAEWEARQAEKKKAEQEQLERLAAMSDDEVVNASMQRVSTDTEKLTRRNMKECVAEFIQTKCLEDIAFARLTMHPRKSMIHCFQYISRKAWDYIQDELKASGIQPGPGSQGYGEASRLTVMNAALDRIEAVLEEPELPDTGRQHIPPQTQPGQPEVRFHDVAFAYQDKEVLHHISFSMRPNSMTALVGPSGGGKSTIANLLARLWDVKSGSVAIRGVDTRQVPLAELMDHISMVFQRVYLFQDTIYNNISMGKPDATEEEVYEAARKARCYDFIMALPDGFQTVVGEGGATLSGGEKQRISIARCILKDAPIVILDEATASVDTDNESYIQEAISELVKGKTLLVIAHRLNTIRNADQILVISDGRISQHGTHEELMEQPGIYQDFVRIRMNSAGWSLS